MTSPFLLHKVTSFAATMGLILATVAGLPHSVLAANRNELGVVVHDICLPAYQAIGTAFPCAEVNIANGLEARFGFSLFALAPPLPSRPSCAIRRGALSAVKAVVAEEVSPLLCRMQDCENAAAMLKSELRALQYCGRFGLCPESLPARLAREPANVFHADRPLTWDKQKVFDRQKAAWCNFADRLREDAGTMLSLGD
jgi:hypothetical protein